MRTGLLDLERFDVDRDRDLLRRLEERERDRREIDLDLVRDLLRERDLEFFDRLSDRLAERDGNDRVIDLDCGRVKMIGLERDKDRDRFDPDRLRVNRWERELENDRVFVEVLVGL